MSEHNNNLLQNQAKQHPQSMVNYQSKNQVNDRVNDRVSDRGNDKVNVQVNDDNQETILVPNPHSQQTNMSQNNDVSLLFQQSQEMKRKQDESNEELQYLRQQLEEQKQKIQQMESNQELKQLRQQLEEQKQKIQQMERQFDFFPKFQVMMDQMKTFLEQAQIQFRNSVNSLKVNFTNHIQNEQLFLREKKMIEQQLQYLPKFQLLDSKIEEIQKQILEIQYNNTTTETCTKKIQVEQNKVNVTIQNLKYNLDYEVKEKIEKYLRSKETSDLYYQDNALIK